MKEAINNGHNGHIYGVKKQETNDELNQTFPKTSITVHDKQESFDVPVVFIHSQVQILLKIHWVGHWCSDDQICISFLAWLFHPLIAGAFEHIITERGKEEVYNRFVLQIHDPI